MKSTEFVLNFYNIYELILPNLRGRRNDDFSGKNMFTQNK